MTKTDIDAYQCVCFVTQEKFSSATVLDCLYIDPVCTAITNTYRKNEISEKVDRPTTSIHSSPMTKQLKIRYKTSLDQTSGIITTPYVEGSQNQNVAIGRTITFRCV